LALSLAEFWGMREAQCGAGSLPKAAAILIGESLFASLGGGLVSTFLKACCMACPLAICKGEEAADEFFETRLASSGKGLEDSSSRPPFVSVVNVVEAPPHVAESSNALSGRPCGCLALLAPLRATPATSHTFHMQPNGDVRVVQSFHEDVMVSESMELASLDRDRPRRHRRSSSSSCSSQVSGCAYPAVAALKFYCAQAQLPSLLGVCFHLGELAIEADAEGSRSGTRDMSSSLAEQQRIRRPASLGWVWEREEAADANEVAECLQGIWILCEQLFAKAAQKLRRPKRV
jgi:hypothetical protein